MTRIVVLGVKGEDGLWVADLDAGAGEPQALADACQHQPHQAVRGSVQHGAADGGLAIVLGGSASIHGFGQRLLREPSCWAI